MNAEEELFSTKFPSELFYTPLTEEALKKHEQQRAIEIRQFSCPICYVDWWRVVPSDKPVSRCKRCHKKYNAIPRDMEYGAGRFICPNERCGEVFYRTCRATYIRDCPQCGTKVGEPHIHPAREQDHPTFLRWFKQRSTPHISTGSTVATWLSQTALNTYPSHQVRHCSTLEISPSAVASHRSRHCSTQAPEISPTAMVLHHATHCSIPELPPVALYNGRRGPPPKQSLPAVASYCSRRGPSPELPLPAVAPYDSRRGPTLELSLPAVASYHCRRGPTPQLSFPSVSSYYRRHPSSPEMSPWSTPENSPYRTPEISPFSTPEQSPTRKRRFSSSTRSLYGRASSCVSIRSGASAGSRGYER